jgi:hypothetical protein
MLPHCMRKSTSSSHCSSPNVCSTLQALNAAVGFQPTVPENTKLLHVVFHNSASRDLKHAITQCERQDTVVCLPDDLSFGPIGSKHAISRTNWIAENLCWTGWDEIILESERAFSTIERYDGPIVAWTSRRSARDLAGFHDLVWRIGQRPVEVVDLSDFPDISNPIGSVSLIPSHKISASALWETARSLPTEAREDLNANWSLLLSEDAPFRAITPDLRLHSVSMNFFDELLLSKTKPNWMLAAQVIESAMESFQQNPLRVQTSDIVLVPRLWSLVKETLLEADRTTLDISTTRVRHPESTS